MTVKIARAAFTLLICAALASCSSSGGGPGPGDTTPPGVTQSNLTDGQTDVGLIHRISVTFSEDMDESTIGDSTVTVSGRAPRGYVDYDDATHTVTFTPDTLYAAQTWHNFILSGEIADEAGNTIDPSATTFQTGPLDTDHLDDYFEPNETPATATPVVFGKRYRTLSLTDGDDDDLFEFTLTETAKVRVAWRFRKIDGLSWVFGFDNEDGEQYDAAGMAPSTGDSANWYYFSFLPGTYYFHTHAHSYQTGYSIYDFVLTTDEPCRDDAYEDNDFTSESVPIGPGTLYDLKLCLMDRDYFRVNLTAGQQLSAAMRATGGTTDNTKRVAILKPDGSDASVMTADQTAITATYTAFQTGTHYIYTMAWSEYVEYELEVTVQ